MTWKIPLYNCYWCRCAYCANEDCKDRFSYCLSCKASGNFKIREFCDKFAEKESRPRIVFKESEKECEECIYKKQYEALKKMLRGIMG